MHAADVCWTERSRVVVVPADLLDPVVAPWPVFSPSTSSIRAQTSKRTEMDQMKRPTHTVHLPTSVSSFLQIRLFKKTCSRASSISSDGFRCAPNSFERKEKRKRICIAHAIGGTWSLQ